MWKLELKSFQKGKRHSFEMTKKEVKSKHIETGEYLLRKL